MGSNTTSLYSLLALSLLVLSRALTGRMTRTLGVLICFRLVTQPATFAAVANYLSMMRSWTRYVCLFHSCIYINSYVALPGQCQFNMHLLSAMARPSPGHVKFTGNMTQAPESWSCSMICFKFNVQPFIHIKLTEFHCNGDWTGRREVSAIHFLTHDIFFFCHNKKIMFKNSILFISEPQSSGCSFTRSRALMN